MGKHYLLNLYDCSFVLLNDEQFLIKLLESAAILSGATVIQTIFKKFDPKELQLFVYSQKVILAFIPGLKKVRQQ